MAITVETRTNIIELVVGMVGAAPGSDILSELAEIVDSGLSLNDLAIAIANNPAFKSLYPSFLTSEEFATNFLTSFIGAEVTATVLQSAIDAMVADLNAGTHRGAAMYKAILAVEAAGETDASFGAAAAKLNNQTEVAIHYSVTTQQSSDSLDSLKAVVGNVTSSNASVTTALAVVNGTANPGITYSLTNAINTINGGGGNDTIIAGTDAGLATLSAGDVISGGAGTDTLVINNSATADNAAALATATISGVELIQYTAGAAAQAISVSGLTGVTGVNLVAGAGSYTTTLTKTQSATLTGTNAAGAGVHTLTYTSATGPADAVTVAMSAYTGGLTLAAIETINFVSTGTSTLVAPTMAAATTVNISGSGFTSFTSVVASVTTKIDGSGTTTGFFFDNDTAGAAVETVTGGNGVLGDTYRTNFANLAATDTINLAGGGNDTLSFSDAVDLGDTTKAAVLAGVTNVEVLDVDGAGAFTVNGDAVAQSIFTHDSTGAFAGTNISSTDSIGFQAKVVAASTVGMKLGQNALNISLTGTAGAISDLGTNGLTVVGASTVNVISSGSSSNVNPNTLALTTDDNGSVIITGSQGLTLTTTQTTGTTGLSINGSAATGALSLTGTPDADIVIGGSAKDTIIGGDGGDQMTGGASADAFTVAITAATTAAADYAAALDIITDFASGADTLEFGAAAGTAVNYSEAAAAVADFATALAAADTALNGTVLYSVQQVGSDTYVFFDADGTLDTAGTEVVKLTGVSLAGIALADIV